MKRIEKVGDTLVSSFTFTIRALIGLSRCIQKNMPAKLEFPFEIRKKGDANGKVEDAEWYETKSEKHSG